MPHAGFISFRGKYNLDQASDFKLQTPGDSEGFWRAELIVISPLANAPDGTRECSFHRQKDRRPQDKRQTSNAYM